MPAFIKILSYICRSSNVSPTRSTATVPSMTALIKCFCGITITPRPGSNESSCYWYISRGLRHGAWLPYTKYDYSIARKKPRKLVLLYGSLHSIMEFTGNTKNIRPSLCSFARTQTPYRKQDGSNYYNQSSHSMYL